jgi:hypothetical protein
VYNSVSARLENPARVGGGPDNAGGPQEKGVHPRTGAEVRVIPPGDVPGPRRPEDVLTPDTATAAFRARLNSGSSSPLTAIHVSLAPQPESRTNEARTYARAVLEHFREPANRDKIYPPAIAKVKADYEEINAKLASVGREFLAGDPFSFDAIELDEFEQLDFERRVDNAVAGVAPEEVRPRAEAAATEFLKEIAESRAGNDRATYLCGWIALRTEMTPKERWTIVQEMAADVLNNKRVDIDFRDRLEALTQDVFVTRAQDYVDDLVRDIENSGTERFFPDDILGLRSSTLGLDWSNPLPDLLTEESLGRLRNVVEGIAQENKPLTERPDDRLREALESHLTQHANALVATTPSLFALREIAGRNGLSRDQKFRVATEIDFHISQAPAAFPQDPSGCPQFSPQSTDRQQGWLRRAINSVVLHLPNAGANPA